MHKIRGAGRRMTGRTGKGTGRRRRGRGRERTMRTTCRASTERRVKGAGRGHTRAAHGKVAHGRKRPAGGWGLRHRRRRPSQSRFKRLISSVTGRH
jgi:hypothetical protein